MFWSKNKQESSEEIQKILKRLGQESSEEIQKILKRLVELEARAEKVEQMFRGLNGRVNKKLNYALPEEEEQIEKSKNVNSLGFPW